MYRCYIKSVIVVHRYLFLHKCSGYTERVYLCGVKKDKVKLKTEPEKPKAAKISDYGATRKSPFKDMNGMFYRQNTKGSKSEPVVSLSTGETGTFTRNREIPRVGDNLRYSKVTKGAFETKLKLNGNGWALMDYIIANLEKDQWDVELDSREICSALKYSSNKSAYLGILNLLENGVIWPRDSFGNSGKRYWINTDLFFLGDRVFEVINNPLFADHLELLKKRSGIGLDAMKENINFDNEKA